ncbi:hypothetical protein [Levilinea saccharolytica]|uniref:Uncharacterized protein n=1 Tax=Levilinea saccharolytica TaxID=229921 RepID=A0A0P6XN87_9CHLR|nr:hypothetical protein [Levilinea saccharolytica]KPL77949.1 hypothetical protein ADN01_15355 [Levilinea saccharolytica]GAP16274.1 hypothetical protein LSAC_00123 [Levilinea saccharolytica]
MDDMELEKAIKSTGKACFVKYYELFRDPTRSNGDLVELLMRQERYAEQASWTRVSLSRKIIRSGNGPKILREILQSDKLDDDIINKAKELLRKYPV